MFSHLNYFVKNLASYTNRTKFNLFLKIKLNRNQPIQYYSKPSNTSSNSEIIDVNIDKMMTEDDELACNYNYDSQSQKITTRNLDYGYIAPVDVNPWADEEFDAEFIDKENDEIHYPEPPKGRSGYYEFEGIKIWLPKRMLTPATYRYRLTEEEQQTLPDDIRICKFEKFKPNSS